MANPPITVGELTDVPAPGSPIASAWSQEVSNRVVQRFATKTALDTWAAAAGSLAVTLDTNTLWQRVAGVWLQKPVVWRAIGNGTTGVVGGTQVPVPGLTLTITTLAGHWYRFTSSVSMQATGAGGAFESRLVEDSTIVQVADVSGAGPSQRQIVSVLLRQPAAGSHTYYVVVVSDAPGATAPNTGVQNNFVIEEIGV